ncbi:MAG: O-antigen ligase family protein, partial [Chloroflexi bacterium]|nr:O-antigen ligase family protein [Chloroflexota bacterium]
WMLDSLATGRLTLPRNRIVGYSLLLLFAYGFSYTYTMDDSRTLSETLRLAFNVLSFLSVMHFVRGERRFDHAIVALVVTGVGVAAIAGFQYVTGIIFWNEQLILQQVARVNATFADPNSLATFMNVVIAISLSGALAVRRLWLRFVLLGAAGACALGLLFSFSRAGWLCGAVVFGLFILLALRSRPVAAFALVCLAAAVAFGLFVAVPQIADRFEQSLEPGALSVRPYLIEAGLIMFLENPVLGVGAGAYRLAAQTEYAFANPFVWYVSASHTAIVTTMAELGIVGLTLTLLICWETIRQLWQIHNDEQRPELHQGYAAGLLLAFLAVLLQAQSVGVFFEEPYLWIILGLTVVLRRWRRTDAGRRPTDDRQQSDPFLRPSSPVVRPQ